MVYSHEIPVPGFIEHAIRIVTRESQAKPKAAGVFAEPVKCRTGLEYLLQMYKSRRTHIHGSAAVMLTVAWRSVDLQDFLNGLPPTQLPFKKLALVVMAPVG